MKKISKSKIALIASTPIAIGSMATGIVLSTTSCTKASQVIVLDAVSKKGVTVRSYKITLYQDSSITLNIPDGQKLDDAQVTISNNVYSKDDKDYFTIEGNTIHLSGWIMLFDIVVLKSVTLVSK